MAEDTLYWADGQAEIHRIVVGPMDNNVFVVRCTQTGDAALLDAANEHERLLELCRRLDVRTVLETHGHWDHIQAIPQVRDAGYEVGITAADADMLPSYDFVLEHDTVIPVGRLRLRTILTPGHTPGSMSFALEDHPVLFTRRHAVPGWTGQHQLRRGRLRHDHPQHRRADVLEVLAGHRGAAGPRRSHHDRGRIPSPRRMDRTGLVSTHGA